MSSKLLLDSQPLVILPELAVAVGLNEAIVLQQVHYWCELYAKSESRTKSRKHYHDGCYWVYNSIREWHKQFPWWKSEGPVKTAFNNLEKRGLLITGNYNETPWDRTKWYRVNYEKLEELAIAPLGKIYPMDSANFIKPIPETNTENNNGKKEKGFFSMGSPMDIPSENPPSPSVPIVEPSDKGVSWFIDWYFKLYSEYYEEPHPKIKSKQRIRVTEMLATFMDENGLDEGALQEMAYAFFDNVENTDHNINHFATSGILENRYYEAVY